MVINIDVDLSPPQISVKNVEDYDGSNEKKRKFLWKNREHIIDWLPEYQKSYDMSAFGRLIVGQGGGKKSIRMRKVNRNLVIPERVREKLKKIEMD